MGPAEKSSSQCVEQNSTSNESSGNAPGSSLIIPAGPWRQPEGEAAELLVELAGAAEFFDPSDYWVDESWDLEALWEDVRQQRDDLFRTLSDPKLLNAQLEEEVGTRQVLSKSSSS